MKYLFSVFLLVISLFSCAQQKEATENYKKLKGENIINYNNFEKIRTKKTTGKITAVYGYKGVETSFRFETLTQPDFIFKLASAIPIYKKEYQKGQTFLLSFKAKTEKSSFETGEAKVLWLLKQSKTRSKNITKTINLVSEWKTYYIPFVLTENVSNDLFGLVIQFGFRPQSFLIKNLKFEAFPLGTNIADLPKTKITYEGIEKEAVWRKEALNRIEKIRKGNAEIQLIKNGKPLANTEVQIVLKKHQFRFGAALRTKDIINNTLVYQKFKETFDLVVLENGLKVKMWQFEKKRENTLKALEILKKDKIDVKGHVLIWPSFKYLSKEIKNNKDNPKKVKTLMLNHVTDILNTTKGFTSEWDVVNEVYTNRELQKLTGSEDILYEGFKLVKKLQPKALRLTNEYGILSNGGIDTKKQQWYYDFIKRLDKNTNGLVNGIGIQSHIGSDLTTPKKVLEVLDFYASLGKDISISEFTMDIQDPEIREKYTRDFIIAAFSHPNVTQFLFWGFMDNKFKKVNLFNKDGSLGAMGKAYFSLMNNEFKTDLRLTTDTNGKLYFNGFYGDYDIKIKQKEATINKTFSLVTKGNNAISINID